jgi:DNA mismatch repair ATPase MutS
MSSNAVASGSGDLVVKQARHPCLEVQDDISFIANDHVMLKGECGHGMRRQLD